MTLRSAASLVLIAALTQAASAAPAAPAQPAPAKPAPAAALPAPAPAAPATPTAPPAPNAPHETFTFASTLLGETRRLNLYLPPGYRDAGATRYPVLYLLDGGDAEDFPSPHILATIDQAIRSHEMAPYVVVGIENTERRRDLLGPTTLAAELAVAPHAGGSSKFRAFLRDIDDQRARLAGILGKHAPRGLTYFWEPRSDLRHANIYETVALGVLRRLFRAAP